MLPWLAFSEAIGRAPHAVLEQRNLVKKLVFPVEILPVVQTVSGLVTSGFALLVFSAALLLIRHSLPATFLALPLIVVPQAMWTLGLAWLLAAIGVFFRDLTQIIGFVLTLLFFLTPICYPESALPKEALPVLTANPIYAFVQGYRNLLLDATLPSSASLVRIWLLSLGTMLFGYAVFHKLRRIFPDVI
jgi:lipopolysaccharide transport system permease protein